MAMLGLCLLLALASALLLRRRPVVVVAIAVLLWFAVPAVGAHWLTGVSGGTLGFHPSTFLLVMAVAVQLLFAPQLMLATLLRHRFLLLIVATFAVAAGVTSHLMQSGGLRLLGDQILAPFLAFWLVTTFAVELRALEMLRNVLLFCVAAECGLSLLQRTVGELLTYESDFEQLYWFNPERFTRWMGTTDSPLILSTAICAAAPLAVGLRRTWVRLLLAALFVVGVVIVQSRTGAVVIAVVILYVVVRARVSLLNKLLVSAAVVAAGGYLLSTTLVTGLTERVGDDTGSSEARGAAYRFFFTHLSDWLFVGQGLTGSYRVTDQAGLITSLESSYLMYSVDVGVLLATAYFGAQLALLAVHRGAPVQLIGAVPAALLATLLQHTFSGLGSANLLGTLVWVLIAMAVAPVREQLPRRAHAVESSRNRWTSSESYSASM